MPKLKTITFDKLPGLPGLRPSSFSTIHVGQHEFADFEIHLNAGAIVIVKPAVDGKPRQAYEIPRSNAFLLWDLEDGDEAAARRDFTYVPAPKPARIEPTHTVAAQNVAVLADDAPDDDPDEVVPVKRKGGR